MPASRRTRKTRRYKPYKQNKVKRLATYPLPNSKRLKALIKSVSLKQSETKYTVTSNENTQLFHNGGVTGVYIYKGNLLETADGVGQNRRIGDEVVAKGVKIKLWLSNKSDRTNVTYRIFVIASQPTDIGISPASLFENDIGNKLLDSFNTDRYKIVKHKLIKIGSDNVKHTGPAVDGFVGAEQSRAVSMWIPLKNRKVVYQADAGGLPRDMKNCLSFGIVAYDSFGTLTTDNIASFAYSIKFYYKDP